MIAAPTSVERRPASWLIVALAATAAVAGVLLASPAPTSAYVTANTIDPVATRAADGDRIRVSGPIGCTNERIVISVRIDQPSTGASARGRWRGRCSGEVQHWVVRARADGGVRFEDGRARVRASALGGRHRWSETVEVLRRGFPKP